MFSLRTLVQRAHPVAAAAAWAAPKVPVLAISQRFFSLTGACRFENEEHNSERSFDYSDRPQRSDRPDRRHRQAAPPVDAFNNFVSKTATSVEEGRNEGRVVSVNNVPYDARWEDVFRVFGYYGEIERIKFPKQGACFIHFVNVSSVEKSIQALNNTFFHNRRIFVRKPDGPYTGRPSKFEREQIPNETIYMGNMPYDVTEQEISDIVMPFGDVKEIRVPKNNDTGLSRGFAHVRFESIEKATEVIEKLQGVDVRDRALIANFASEGRAEKEKKLQKEFEKEEEAIQE